MKVIKAETMGMCFGVQEAITRVYRIKKPHEVSIYGELVHNSEVLKRISGSGIHIIPESDRPCLPNTKKVLVTAHGLSNKERKWLISKGKKLIDTSCPLVTKVHNEAQRLQRLGYTVIILGKKNHVEVKGITGDLDRYIVVEDIEEVYRYNIKRLGIICQSTCSPEKALYILQRIKRLNHESDIHFTNTICKPSWDRQIALQNLLKCVEALVVLGGKNSNNTKQLVRLAREKNLPCFHIQTVDDIDSEQYKNFSVIGLSAGTSTLDSSIDEVYEKLLSIHESNLIKGKGMFHKGKERFSDSHNQYPKGFVFN
ncbi:MAG: 4-hydroxy-3-methylbut-2-enyl diphosphate reductase [bacterium]|nr:MAG: 4-hydroxy-3-methylbut-2-enyl diphosphate reductase [bacterium]